MDIAGLSAELTNDPLGRGYSTMTDQEVADSLNTEDRELIRSTLTGSTIFNAIDPTEFGNLTADQQRFVRDVFLLGDAVDVGPGTNAREVLLGAFPSGATYDNLVAAVTVNVTRAQELNILGGSPEVGPAHVAKARS